MERMGLAEDHALQKQIFWAEKNRAVRPMLAQNLYSILADLLRIAGGGVSVFEVGVCLRRESKGRRHAEEFTMLNVCEMGLRAEDRLPRAKEIARLVLEAAEVPPESCEYLAEESGVYGETMDILSPGGLELASTAMGPHPLDAPWGITVPWVGLGFGLERLIMARAQIGGENPSLARGARSLTHLCGVPLNIPGKRSQ